MKTEFADERAEIINNLVLEEDHGTKKKLMCPFCAEKHASKIIGYADEIATGNEPDKELMEQLANTFRDVKDKLIPELKKHPTEKGFNILAQLAREWRRRLQGAGEHSHSESCEHQLAECIAAGKTEEECKVNVHCH